MLLRSSVRRAAAAAAAGGSSVPDVMVTFGTRVNQMTFVSHPGVMAVAKLLEMRFLSRPRAVLTQENVDAIWEFDGDLAKKCQIALDNGLHINFMELEHICKPGYLDKLKREKDIIEMARNEVLNAPAGEYRIPSILSEYERPEVPSSLRPELQITQEMFDAEPGLLEEIELNKVMKLHLQKQIAEEKGSRAVETPGAKMQLNDGAARKQIPS